MSDSLVNYHCYEKVKDNKSKSKRVSLPEKNYFRSVLRVESGPFRPRFKSKVYICSGNDYSFNQSQVF